MKALLLNVLVGIILGRFCNIWFSILALIPLVMVEVAYGIVVHELMGAASLRRAAALLITAEFAFFVGALLRPHANETTI